MPIFFFKLAPATQRLSEVGKNQMGEVGARFEYHYVKKYHSAKKKIVVWMKATKRGLRKLSKSLIRARNVS